MAVLADLFRGPLQAHREAVLQGPGVGIVTVPAAPHAAGRPRHHPHAGPVHRGAGGEGVQEPHIAGGERLAYGLLRDLVAEPHPQLERVLRGECRQPGGPGVGHGYGSFPLPARRAVTVISMCPSPTSLATTTVVRVGRGSLK